MDILKALRAARRYITRGTKRCGCGLRHCLYRALIKAAPSDGYSKLRNTLMLPEDSLIGWNNAHRRKAQVLKIIDDAINEQKAKR